MTLLISPSPLIATPTCTQHVTPVLAHWKIEVDGNSRQYNMCSACMFRSTKAALSFETTPFRIKPIVDVPPLPQLPESVTKHFASQPKCQSNDCFVRNIRAKYMWHSSWSTERKRELFTYLCYNCFRQGVLWWAKTSSRHEQHFPQVTVFPIPHSVT